MVIEDSANKVASQQRGLIKWQKGQSGNPTGRPKDPVTALIREKLHSPSIRGGDGSVADDVVLELLNIAFTALPAEKMRAIEYMLNRTEGSPRQSVEVTTGEDDPSVAAMRNLAAAIRAAQNIPEPTPTPSLPTSPAALPDA